MIPPKKEFTKESVLDAPIIIADSAINKLPTLKIFDPADIIELFRMNPLSQLPDSFDELGLVKVNPYSVVVKEDGTYVFQASITLEAKI